MAHFTLTRGEVSKAIVHKTVDEVWYCVDGSGEMWREFDGKGEITLLRTGTCVSIPVGTRFQFRAGEADLKAVAVTMPPWPGEDEAVFVEGIW